MTCLRQEGKVIFPILRVDLTISLVTSLHFLQTQAQTTTFCRWGHRSSLSSTRFIISPSNSGNKLAQPLTGSDSAHHSPETSPPRRPETSATPSSCLWLFTDLNDLEILRERIDFRRDIRVINFSFFFFSSPKSRESFRSLSRFRL